MKGRPKLKINVPMLPVATMMQRRFHFHTKGKGIANERDKGSIRVKPKTSLCSVFCSVIGNKRYSLAKYPSKVKKNGTEKHNITTMASSNEFEPKSVVTSLSQLLLLEQALENNDRGEGKKNIMDRQILNILLGFLEKKKWNDFIKSKWRVSKTDLHGIVTRFGQVRRKVSSWRSTRIPSNLVVIRLKLKTIRSLVKKKLTKQFEHEAEVDNDRELCKKRILMGRRCRPLCSPGPYFPYFLTNAWSSPFKYEYL